MPSLNPIEHKILTVLVKRKTSYMTTARVAEKAGISWNTAESYLQAFHNLRWVSKKTSGRTVYWKARFAKSKLK